MIPQTPLSTEQLFSMRAFEGLRQLRIFHQRRLEASIDELIDIVRKLEIDPRSLDLLAAKELHEIVPQKQYPAAELFYRECIAAVLLKRRPKWLKAVTQGRSRFLNSLGRDEQSLFRHAGLVDELPDQIVVRWWDVICGAVRQDSDQEKMLRARRAERLTIEFEKARLQQLGIELEPQWKGLDDNFAGYDVLSFDPGDPVPNNRLIEVKSSVASPLRLILTRNEWETAKEKGDSYVFHIWDLRTDSPVLHVRTVVQISDHIPADTNKGKWTAVDIPIGSMT